jgi:hypothetical protein
VRHIVAALDPEDLQVWGYPQEAILAALDRARGAHGARVRPPFDRYRLQRKALVMLRRNIHHNALGRVLTRARFYLDVLLRE